jgi:mRNA-degrading endonuclease RelE of RelBE toxin-antitoxin system
VTGSILFSIEESEKFKRSLKKLKKFHGNTFVERVLNILEDLMEDPYPLNSRQEPLPGKMNLQPGWTFHKLDFSFSKGASGQIRLMYLVNAEIYVITPMWIYSHEQFTKRPADADLMSVIKEILEC